MVATVLVNEDIAAGEDVLQALEVDRVDVRAAFWFYKSDADEYSLTLVLPLVDERGLAAGYKTIHKSLSKHRIGVLTLLKISVIGTKDPLARAIRRAVALYSGLNGSKRHLRLRRDFIAGISIEDAYVYRSK